MQKLSIVLILLINLLSCQATKRSEIKKRAILVSIDGLRPEFYLDPKYPAPNLQSLAKKSFRVKGLTPVFPSVTYPNHTTLITGVNPSEHGILSNSIFSWKDGPTTQWYWDKKYIKVKTIMDILEEKGHKTASIHWPVTLNANITYLMPEIFPLKPWHDGSTWELVRKYDSNDIVDEITKEKKLKPFTNQKESDAWATEAAKYLLEVKKPKLTLLHLTYLDHLQHNSGRESAETYASVKLIDEHIASLLKSVDQDTCLMIVGDHGFIDYSTQISINNLFKDKGWLKVNKDGEVVSWKVIAHKSGAQAAIYLKDKSLENKVTQLLRKNTKLGYEYVSKSKLQKLGAYPEAMAAISAKEGYSFGYKIGKKLISKTKKTKGQHGHLPYHDKIQTGLIAYNCGLKPSMQEKRMLNTKVAPMLLKILGE